MRKAVVDIPEKPSRRLKNKDLWGFELRGTGWRPGFGRAVRGKSLAVEAGRRGAGEAPGVVRRQQWWQVISVWNVDETWTFLGYVDKAHHIRGDRAPRRALAEQRR